MEEKTQPPFTPPSGSEENPFSFFKYGSPSKEEMQELDNDEQPPSVLPVLSSDSEDEWDNGPNPSSVSQLDMLLGLPDVSDDHSPQLPSLSDDEDTPPIGGMVSKETIQATSSDSSWKERALIAERNSLVWENKYQSLRFELNEAEDRIKQLKKKEKADSEKMDAVLQKVEKNLQLSRVRYEERLGKMKLELDNAKRMIQHLTQCEDVKIPDNFEEYQEFMNNGKAKALYASEKLSTLAESAEAQVKDLLKGCAALKELSVLLSNVDKFAEQQSTPPI